MPDDKTPEYDASNPTHTELWWVAYRLWSTHGADGGWGPLARAAMAFAAASQAPAQRVDGHGPVAEDAARDSEVFRTERNIARSDLEAMRGALQRTERALAEMRTERDVVVDALTAANAEIRRLTAGLRVAEDAQALAAAKAEKAEQDAREADAVRKIAEASAQRLRRERDEAEALVNRTERSASVVACSTASDELVRDVPVTRQVRLERLGVVQSVDVMPWGAIVAFTAIERAGRRLALATWADGGGWVRASESEDHAGRGEERGRWRVKHYQRVEGTNEWRAQLSAVVTGVTRGDVL